MFKRLLILAVVPLLMISCDQTKPEPDNPDPATTSLQAPKGVTVKACTQTTVELGWAAVAGAESYAWRLTKDSSPVVDGTNKETSVTIDGLEPATTYRFTVRAISAGGTSPWSEAVNVTTQAEEQQTPAGKTQCVDAPLVLSFEGTPTLGSSGKITIFKKDGTKVDQINLADIMKVKQREDGTMVPATVIDNNATFHTFMDALPCSGRWRPVHYTPLRAASGKLIIKPHTGVLDFNTEYYVTIDAGVINGFQGTQEGEWTFSTGSAPKSATELRVAADGSGDFCTLQRALDYADKNGCTITIARGTYQELLFAREKSNITLKGESRSGVSIIYPNNESYESGSGASVSSRPQDGSSIGKSGGRGLFLIENCDNMVIEDLTIENSFGEQKGQAETIYFNSGSNAHRLTIENCSLISYQDTFLTKGKVWVHNSLIAGHVDFIWGYPDACLFEDCEIRSRAGGYIIQARVPSASNKGFVFLNCDLTAEDGVKEGSVYLARSAGQADCIDNVVYVNCRMGKAIAPAGWYTNPAPNPAKPTATSGWREYNSHDAGGNAVTGHNAYGLTLSSAEAEPYSSRQAVLGY